MNDGRTDGSSAERAAPIDMTDAASRVLDAAMKLSDLDRAELALILFDSIGDGSSSEEVQSAWIAEAERRAEAIERGELELIDSDEMMARLRARVRSRGGVVSSGSES